MYRFYRNNYRWLRHLPRRKHLKGSRLHQLLGERLFSPELWRSTRNGIAGGLAIGLLIGFTPTMGAQFIMSGALACLLRVNIPIALAGTLVTNPLTAAVIYPLEYRVGVWLTDVPDLGESTGYTGALQTFASYAKPLWIGSLLVGSVAACIAYGLVMLLWKEAGHQKSSLQRTPEPPDGRHSRTVVPVNGLKSLPRAES